MPLRRTGGRPSSTDPRLEARGVLKGEVNRRVNPLRASKYHLAFVKSLLQELAEARKPLRRLRLAGFGARLFLSRRPRWAASAVFLGFLVVTFALFTPTLVNGLTDTCAGACVRDFRLYIWSMEWLRHALATGVDPFKTNLLWAPLGTDLTWVTTLPAPALAMLPVTATLGPIAAANTLLLLAPPLAGWAMFLLCRELTGRSLPSLAGAAVFAYSTYVSHLMRAQLNLLLMFWMPLGLYLFMLHFRGRLSSRKFLMLGAAVLCGQFLTSTEVFALTAFAYGVAWLVFIVATRDEMRAHLLGTLPAIVGAYLLAAVVLSPLILRTLGATPNIVLRPTEQNSSDLLGPLLPGRSTWLGSDFVAGITGRFLDPDNLAYVGLPLILVVVLASLPGALRRPGQRALTFLFVLFLVLSMGPRLHLLGARGPWLPGQLLGVLPLIQHAVPIRYVLFAWAALAVIVAFWLGDATSGRSLRYALVVVGVVALLPSQASVRDTEPVYHQPIQLSSFFASPDLGDYVGGDDVVLAIPAHVGEELLWQVASGMRFRLANAYIGPTKPKNGLGNLSLEDPAPTEQALLRQIETAGVTVVISPWPTTQDWSLALEVATGTEPSIVDGFALYEVQSGNQEERSHDAG